MNPSITLTKKTSEIFPHTKDALHEVLSMIVNQYHGPIRGVESAGGGMYNVPVDDIIGYGAYFMQFYPNREFDIITLCWGGSDNWMDINSFPDAMIISMINQLISTYDLPIEIDMHL